MKILKKPKISVIIPTFESQKTIRRALSSVLSQTFSDFEILISDNNSKDGTKKILKSIKNKKVKVFYQKKNIGTTKNNLFLLKKSKCKYAIVLGADDYYLSKNSLKKMYKDILKYKVVCSSGNFLRSLTKPDGKPLIIKTNLKNIKNILLFLYSCASGQKFNLLWYALWEKNVLKSKLEIIKNIEIRNLSLDRTLIFFSLVEEKLRYHISKNILYYKKVKRSNYKKVKRSKKRGVESILILEFYKNLELLFKKIDKFFLIKILYIILSFFINFMIFFYKYLFYQLKLR